MATKCTARPATTSSSSDPRPSGTQPPFLPCWMSLVSSPPSTSLASSLLSQTSLVLSHPSMSLALVLLSQTSPALSLPSQTSWASFIVLLHPKTFLALSLPSHMSWALSSPPEAIKHLALPLLCSLVALGTRVQGKVGVLKPPIARCIHQRSPPPTGALGPHLPGCCKPGATAAFPL